MPDRFDDRFRDSVDVSAGRVVAKALEAVDQVIAGTARGLLLSGPPGCGKSLLAAVACTELADPDHVKYLDLWYRFEDLDNPPEEERPEGWREMRRRLLDRLDHLEPIHKRRCPRWVSVPATLGGLKREMRREARPEAERLEDILASTGALVLDDLGAEKVSDWTIETLFELAASRYDAGLPLIVTSNLTVTELRDVGYERIVSRVADDGFLVEMRGAKDYRLQRRRSLAV